MDKYPPDIHLYFPPQWSPFQPFLSTPSIKAYLEANGFSARQDDLNVGFYEYFISQQRLELARNRLQRYVSELGAIDYDYKCRCVLALAILNEYDDLYAKVGLLRSPDTLENISILQSSIDALEKLLEAFSAAEPIIDIGHSSFKSGKILDDDAATLDFVSNEKLNPFISYFKDSLSNVNPNTRYIGISIIGSEQILPGLTLAHLIKQRFCDIPILIGGSVFSRLVEKDTTARFVLENFCDYIYRYEGESSLVAFMLSKDPRKDRVNNIAFMLNNEVILTDLAPPPAVNSLPTPDFSDLNIKSYLTPHIVLPILSTRGCYWGKCAFCYHGMIYQDRYRMRDPSLLAEDIRLLNERTNAIHFAFNDEALPPKLFSLLPEAVTHGVYYFTGLYKFEKYFKLKHYKDMYDVGFRSLYIGLESASERVQVAMRKSNTQNVMISNLSDANQAGIWNHTFNFFGFPSETEDEAKETMDFLFNYSNIIHSEGTGTFSYEQGAPVSQNPELYGIDSAKSSGGLFSLYYDYTIKSGLNAAQAEEALNTFRKERDNRGLYQDGTWIPREMLLLLLSKYTKDDLIELLKLPPPDKYSRVYCITINQSTNSQYFVVNVTDRIVSEINIDAKNLLHLIGDKVSVDLFVSVAPMFSKIFHKITSKTLNIVDLTYG